MRSTLVVARVEHFSSCNMNRSQVDCRVLVPGLPGSDSSSSPQWSRIVFSLKNEALVKGLLLAGVTVLLVACGGGGDGGGGVPGGRIPEAGPRVVAGSSPSLP